MLWVACLLLLTKAIGAGKEVLLASAYGTGPLMDAYQFTLQMASWPVSIFLAIGSGLTVGALVAVNYAGNAEAAAAALASTQAPPPQESGCTHFDLSTGNYHHDR